ncbi:MAG: TetR/AcrR family transcriptional regulator [Bacilli bacterium]|nr:TetR/AcrR family transcriptional regulator [Bacilli bacterium]
MNIKNNRRVSLTKTMIKEALMDLLEQKDISKISIRELCALANINRSTFYKYYKSQYDLLKEMEGDLINLVNKELNYERLVLDEITSTILYNILKFIYDNQRQCRLLFNSNKDHDFEEKIFHLPAILKQMELHASTDQVVAQYEHVFILHGAYNIILAWLNTGCREDPDIIAKIIFQLFIKIKYFFK